ncbi:hypothetical protein AB241_03760 [Salmonella enterica]|nr:hypothetical protein [Salmonella enterica]EDR6196442.1 hypothetical protein [Salmonella enterica subsp. enterica serovar Aqua]EAX1488484.1 hypothetical protein [Salmonella enterica]EAX1577686.1 hypothetical protein [Salmonella enterica]EBA6159015.1 hypothetical protein [Salmonella enterica]
MSNEYVIFRIERGNKMYLTDLPEDDNPLGGIGFQSSHYGTVPSGAGTCPTEDDARKVIAYLRQAIGTNYDHFGFEERPAS